MQDQLSTQDQLLENRDSHGRPLIHTLTDRELAEETVLILRTLTDILEQLGQNPMLSMMIPGGFPQ
jgi:hypothetical protein